MDKKWNIKVDKGLRATLHGLSLILPRIPRRERTPNKGYQITRDYTEDGQRYWEITEMEIKRAAYD